MAASWEESAPTGQNTSPGLTKRSRVEGIRDDLLPENLNFDGSTRLLTRSFSMNFS